MVRESHISRSDFITDFNEVHEVSHAAVWAVRGPSEGKGGCKGPWGGHVPAVSQETQGGADRVWGDWPGHVGS